MESRVSPGNALGIIEKIDLASRLQISETDDKGSCDVHLTFKMRASDTFARAILGAFNDDGKDVSKLVGPDVRVDITKL